MQAIYNKSPLHCIKFTRITYTQYTYMYIQCMYSRSHTCILHRIVGNFHMVQNFAFLVDRLGATKI
jgi:hypothetical protein